jgi:hypothetical protein
MSLLTSFDDLAVRNTHLNWLSSSKMQLCSRLWVPTVARIYLRRISIIFMLTLLLFRQLRYLSLLSRAMCLIARITRESPRKLYLLSTKRVTTTKAMTGRCWSNSLKSSNLWILKWGIWLITNVRTKLPWSLNFKRWQRSTAKWRTKSNS